MNLAEIGKKYGALGILSAWMALNTIEIKELKTDLKECTESRIDFYKEVLPRMANKKTIAESVRLIAVLPTNENKKRRYERS